MRPFARKIGRASFLAALLAGIGCGADDTGPTEPGVGPALTLQPSHGTVSLRPGGTAVLSVEVIRSGGFTGPVTLTVRDLPEGIDAGPATVPEGVARAALSFHAVAEAREGSATVAVEAVGPGLEPTRVTLTLTVEAAGSGPEGGFSLALHPAVLSIRQGQGDSVRVTVSRDAPFEGPVHLDVTAVPKDVSAIVDPATVWGTEAVILVEVDVDAALGDAGMTLVGRADGAADQRVDLVLTTFGADLPR